MVHPVAALIEQARYRELLQKAEAEHKVMAGPAEAERSLVGLGNLLLALGAMLNK